jgi:hypothetical protein
VVRQFLVSAWQEVGLPGALYLDNDTVWNGGGRGRRVLSAIVRLCLAVGSTVIFLPPYTYEANPVMESFNSVWAANFWSRMAFRDLEHVQTELPFFEHYCRHRRLLSEFDGKTADQLAPDFQPRGLSLDFDLHLRERLPITAGHVHFIRFVSSTGTCSVLNEEWALNEPPAWAGKTIRASIDTEQQTLRVFHQPNIQAACELIAEFAYPLGEEAVPLDEEYRRPVPTFWPVSEVCDC